jgi:hypothetical protein
MSALLSIHAAPFFESVACSTAAIGRSLHLNTTLVARGAQLIMVCGRIGQSSEDLGKTPHPYSD